jgi:uncharacterized protein DUF6545
MDCSLIDYLAGGLVVVPSTYKLCRTPRTDAVLRQLNIAFVCLGLGLLVLATPPQIVSRLDLIPYLGKFLEMLAATFLGLAAYAVRTPNRLSVVRLRMLVIAVGMIGFARFAAVFYGYIGDCLVMFVVLVRPIDALRGALRTLVAAASIGVAWAVWNGVRPWLDTTAPIGTALGLLSILLWLWGSVLIAWRLQSSGQWLHAYIACRRLRPLWTALRNDSTRPGYTPIHRAHFALYRRLIEIRDGQLALRAHLPPTAADWATQATTNISDKTTRAAVIEATKIAAALAARAVNATNRSHPEPPIDAPDADVDLAAETEWLLAVAKAFTTSPIPAMARRRFGE